MESAVEASWRRLLGPAAGAGAPVAAGSADPDVPVGSRPAGVALAATQAGLRAFVANEGDGTVSVVSGTAVTATVQVGSVPIWAAAAPDGTRVYVTNAGEGTVSAIETATDTLVIRAIKVGAEPLGAAVAPDGSTVYVANFGANTVSVIPTAGSTVSATVTVGYAPFGVAFTPDSTRVYVTNSDDNTVSVVKTSDQTVSTFQLKGTRPYGLAITPNGTRAYIANNSSGTVDVVDTTSNTVVASVPVGGNPTAVAIGPDGVNAYVSDGASGLVSVIDTATNTVKTNLQAGTSPFGVAVSPDGTTLYVTDNSANMLRIMPATVAATTTVLASGPEPSAFGQQKTLTATVASSTAGTPTGTVSFYDGTTLLGTAALGTSGQAAFSTTALSVGTHTLTAAYSGDAKFGGSRSAVDQQTVVQAATTTSLTAAPSPSVTGQSVTLSASVAPVAPGAGTPTGTVDFFDGAALLGTSAVDSGGLATLTVSTLGPGAHTLTASYRGDTDFHGSSGTVTQYVLSPQTVLSAAPARVALDFATLKFYIPVLSATLADQSGVRIPGQTITFTATTVAGPVLLGTAVTGVDGTATLTHVVVPPTVVTTNTYTADFAGGAGLQPVSATAALTFTTFPAQ